MIRRAKRNKYDKLLNDINDTDRKSNWWKLVKTCINPAFSTIPTLVTGPDDNKVYHNDDLTKATVLNDLFTNVTNINDDSVNFPRLTPITDNRLDSILLTNRDVIEAIDTIPSNKSPGPDHISPIVIKHVKNTLAPILVRLFNRSLKDSKFPSVWKRANVVPIHKKDSRSDPSNYRPISLTSILSKIFEKAVVKYLLIYLLINNLIYEYQSGFLPKHSPTHQLLEIYHCIVSNLKDNMATSIVFADISRAFDRLSHRGLYCKFDLYGFSTDIKDWLFSFLTGRAQRTCVNGVYSDWSVTRGGVGQGSVLGPLLFLLMINDLPSHLHNKVRLFADDTSIIFSHNPSVDITDMINSDMTRLKQWADTWMIDLNPTKTKCMHVSFAHNTKVPSPFFNNTPIEIVHSHKHLGLVLNDTATWKDHIDYLTKKTAKRIGILRSLKYRLSRAALRTIYITHIRSILEYCDVVWDGCGAAQSVLLEGLQRDCLRIITGLPTFCRLDHLYKESGICPLFERRRQHRLLLLFKSVILNQCPSYFNSLITPLRIDPSVRNDRHLNTFSPYPVTRSATFLRSFFPTTISDWNQLDVASRCATSISAFKRLIGVITPAIPILLEKPRFASIIYSRLKCNCSSLNYHLFHSNLVDSPMCPCNTGPENTFHYLYNCPFYDVEREILMLDLDDIGLIDLSVLFDCEAHNNDPAKILAIQSSLYRFIISTKRFS